MIHEFPRRPRRHAPDPKYMSVIEHLEELRARLVKSIVSIAVGSVAGWFLAPQVIGLLVAPIRRYIGPHLYVNTVYGGFTLNLKIAIIVGFMFALPVTLYQAWAFIAPAFGTKANRYAPIWMSSALGLFILGGITGYEIIPLALRFFGGYQTANVQVLPFADQYIGFVALILIVFGISFELPLALVSLTTAGITSSGALARKRLYAFFGIFAFATVATPGADWISPLILGGILYVLFELSIVVSRMMGK
jgi:sec-independent protein translocase protein TatC